MDPTLPEPAPTTPETRRSPLREKLTQIITNVKRLPAPMVFGIFIIVGLTSVLVLSYALNRQNTASETPLVTLHGKPILLSNREIEMKAEYSDSIGVEMDSTFVLASEKELPLEVIKQSLSVSPEIPLEITQKTPYKVLVAPREHLRENAVYTFSLSEGVIAGVDDTIPYKWAFQTKNSFSVVTSIPRNQATHVPVNSGIEVTFSHENFNDPLPYVSISPTTELVFERHQKTAVFIPAKLEPNTVYTFTIKGDLPIRGSDEKLGEDVVIRFETTSNYDENTDNSKYYFNFSKQSVEIAPGTEPAIGVYSYYYREDRPTSLQVEVYKYPSTDRFLAEITRRDTIPTWSAKQWDVYQPDTTELERIASFTGDIQYGQYQGYVLFPEPLPQGQYLAIARNEHFTSSVLIQVSTLTAYHTIAKNTSHLWLNTTDTQQPVSGAQVTVLPTTSVGSTNIEGLLSFDSSVILADTTKLHYLLIKHEGQTLVVPSNQAYYGENRAFEDIHTYWATNSEYWSYVYVDKPIYQQSDIVNYWGILKHRDVVNSPTNAHIRLARSQDSAILQENDLAFSPFGTFEGSLLLRNVSPGYYYVELTVGEQRIRTQYIHIKPYTKPSYTLSLQADRKGVFAGDTVQFTGEAQFYNGAPVAGLELTYRNTDIKADEKGTFSFPFTPTYDASTYYPSEEILKIRPRLSEEAEIQASAPITVFGPKYDLSTTVIYPDNSSFLASATVSEIDVAAYNAGSSYKKNPDSPVNVAITVKEMHYEKKEDGQYYDFVTKKVVKKYRYDTVSKTVESLTRPTNSAGIVEYSRTFIPDVWYEISFSVTDAQGRIDREATTAYNWSRYDTFYSQDGYSLHHKNQQGQQEGYTIGEDVTLAALKDGAPMTDTGTKKFLYIKAQRGIRDIRLSSSPEYSFTYSEKDLPNITIVAIYFDGTTYRVMNDSVRVNQESRTLSIDVKPQKSTYGPREEVVLDIQTKNAGGIGVPALVNFSVVDEAVFAVSEQYTQPVSDIYQTVDSGISFSYATHQYPLDRSAGEMGAACFTGDTPIAISPTQTKPIKDIQTGDTIFTFGASRENGLIEDTVTGVDVHTVSQILVINEHLKVTPEHVVFINNSWMPIGSAKIGDSLIDSNGKPVTITSIRKEYGTFTVYNLHIEKNHTFIANNIYVHNSKDGTRSVFVDTPFFGSVTTNNTGKGIAKFALPDNLTQWRLTYHGVTNDLLVGTGKSLVYTTKPVFVQPSMNNTYVIEDAPSISLRTFGSALTANDEIKYSVSIPSLGWDSPHEYTQKAFEQVLIQLPELTIGNHQLTVEARTEKGSDTVMRTFEVLHSRTYQKNITDIPITPDTRLENIQQPTTVTLANAQRNRYYAELNYLAWLQNERVDFALVRNLAREQLNAHFNANLPESPFTSGEYEQDGIALLPYGAPDPIVSARLAVVAADKFDRTALSAYFEGFRIRERSSYDELTSSLLGSAALNEPVLQEVYTALDNLDLSIDQRLQLVIGLAILGDFERGYTEYKDILEKHGEEATPYIRIISGDSQDTSITSTALAMIVGTILDDPRAEGMFRYITEYQSNDATTQLESLFYLMKKVPNLSTEPSRVTYVLDGTEYAIELANGAVHAFVVQPDQAPQVVFKDISGDIGATLEWTSAFQQPNDTHITKIERAIFAGDSTKQDSKEIYEDNIVRVEIPYRIEDGNEGCYSVVDYLPSGLKAVSRSYRDYGYIPNDQIYPYRIDENAVYYCVPVTSTNRTASGTLIYYARVSSPGTYTFDGTVFQSDKVPSDRAIGKSTSIIIKPR